VLVDDDAAHDRQALAGAPADLLGREERIVDLVADRFGDPGAAIGDRDLDVRAEKLWTFESWRLSVYLDVQNIYNASNPEATLWDYRYRESAPLRGLPLLPTFGLKGEF